MRGVRSIRYYPRFPEAVPVRGAGCPRVTQPFATLCTPGGALTVRLACVRRAASVHPEPGSNSPFKVPGGSCRRAFRLVRPSRPKIPLISDSLKLTSLCVRDSNFAGLSSSISRSQYPVFKVRRAGRGRLPRRCAGINYTHPAAPRGRESGGSRFLHNLGSLSTSWIALRKNPAASCPNDGPPIPSDFDMGGWGTLSPLTLDARGQTAYGAASRPIVHVTSSLFRTSPQRLEAPYPFDPTPPRIFPNLSLLLMSALRRSIVRCLTHLFPPRCKPLT